KPDLAVSNSGSANVSVLLGNGDGSFQAARSFGAGSNAWSVAVGDFNGDGTPDLAVTNYGRCGAFGWYNSSVSVLLGNGDGCLPAARSFGAGSTAWSVAVGDFNGDAFQDLALANSGLGVDVCCASSVSVLLGNGDGSFQAAQNFGAGYQPLSVAVRD